MWTTLDVEFVGIHPTVVVLCIPYGSMHVIDIMVFFVHACRRLLLCNAGCALHLLHVHCSSQFVHELVSGT